MNNSLIKKTKNRRATAITWCVIAAFYVLLFLLDNVLPSNSFTLMLVPVLKKSAIYALVCVSMNLLNGFTGLFSLGQAGFMLIGAYTYAILSIPNDVRDSVYQYSGGSDVHFSIPELFSGFLGDTAGSFLGAIVCILLAGLLAAAFAALIGIPVLRLKSDYLAIATLGFAEIIRAVCQWDGLERITSGSYQLRKYTDFSDMKLVLGDTTLKFSSIFPFLISMVCIGIILLLINSSYGRAFKAIRDDEIAAEAMGINLFRHKMLSFVISSFFAGVGGALLAMYQTTIQASAFKTAMTYEILLMVVIGGIGSVSGSCIAAFLFTACNEWWLRFLDSGKFLGLNVPFFRDGFRKVIFSIVIMVVVLFFSQGIMGDKELPEKLRSLRKKKRPATEGEGECHE